MKAQISAHLQLWKVKCCVDFSPALTCTDFYSGPWIWALADLPARAHLPCLSIGSRCHLRLYGSTEYAGL